MLFSTLMDKYLDDDLKPDVQTLLRMKMETPEFGEGKRMDRINDYLDRSIEEIGARIEELSTEKKKPWEELDKLFLALVNDIASIDCSSSGFSKYDDVWTPGLPSSRFYRKKSK